MGQVQHDPCDPSVSDEMPAIIERIEAMRLVREAGSLDQVRRALTLALDASPLACTAELCRRLPVGWHYTAVLAMRVVEEKERERALRVDLLTRDAVREARDTLNP